MENLIQHKNSHKFSTDALLLTQFAPIEKVRQFVDLGTGCGVIALELLKKNKNLHAFAIDFNSELLQTAKENASIYKCKERLTLIHADIKEIKTSKQAELLQAKNACELVVTNPPWYLETQGKLPLEDMKRKALFGYKEIYHDFFAAARFFLKEKGYLAFITIPQRTEDAFLALAKEKFVIKKIQYVHKNSASKAIFILVLAQFKGKLYKSNISDLQVEPPLFLE